VCVDSSGKQRSGKAEIRDERSEIRKVRRHSLVSCLDLLSSISDATCRGVNGCGAGAIPGGAEIGDERSEIRKQEAAS
jgi:hypothetical protein